MSSVMQLLLLGVNYTSPGNLSQTLASSHRVIVLLEDFVGFYFHCIQSSANFSSAKTSVGTSLMFVIWFWFHQMKYYEML